MKDIVKEERQLLNRLDELAKAEGKRGKKKIVYREPFGIDDLQPGRSATHEELCDQALNHYEEISDAACHWNSVVPKAIRGRLRYVKAKTRFGCFNCGAVSAQGM